MNDAKLASFISHCSFADVTFRLVSLTEDAFCLIYPIFKRLPVVSPPVESAHQQRNICCNQFEKCKTFINWLNFLLFCLYNVSLNFSFGCKVCNAPMSPEEIRRNKSSFIIIIIIKPIPLSEEGLCLWLESADNQFAHA